MADRVVQAETVGFVPYCEGCHYAALAGERCLAGSVEAVEVWHWSCRVANLEAENARLRGCLEELRKEYIATGAEQHRWSLTRISYALENKS